MKTREIKPNQDFKHEKKTFKKGRKYEVSLEDAKYFTSAGWVGEPTEGKAQSLEIQDIYEGHEAEVN
jgi:hypothetical protein